MDLEDYDYCICHVKGGPEHLIYYIYEIQCHHREIGRLGPKRGVYFLTEAGEERRKFRLNVDENADCYDPWVYDMGFEEYYRNCNMSLCNPPPGFEESCFFIGEYHLNIIADDGLEFILQFANEDGELILA